MTCKADVSMPRPCVSSDAEPSVHHGAEITFERRAITLDVIAPGTEYVDIVGDGNGGSYILIDQQDRAAFVAKGFQLAVDLAGNARRQSHGGFVDQHDAGVGHQQPCYFHRALLAAA